MRVFKSIQLLVIGALLAGCVPAGSGNIAQYEIAQSCADASGFTKRAMADPAYKTRKIYATDQELAYINRCVSDAGGPDEPWVEPQLQTVQTVPGTLPFPTGYPVMSGDLALWSSLTDAQQRRAILFLQSGSTIRSSLQGD